MRFAPAAALASSLILVAALIAACPGPGAAPAAPTEPLPGCGKDTDCKGSRVCERGQCVEPHGTMAAAGSVAPAPVIRAAPPVAVQVTDGGVPIDGGLGPAVAIPGASPGFHAGYTHQGRSRFRVVQTTPQHLGTFATSGTVFSSPAITDEGVAIFGSHDKRILAVSFDGGEPVLRWQRATGDLVWCAPALGPRAGAGGASPSDGGVPGGATAYIGSDDDKLYALDPADGAVRWTFTAGPCKRAIGFGPEAARCDVDGVTVGPDGTILVVADGAYAVRPDGTVKWRVPLRTHCAAAPAVGPDGTVYFGCQDGRLYAVAADGTKRWDFRTADDIDSPPAVGPDGNIYFGSDDARLYSLTPAGVLRWALKTGGDVRSGPAIAEDGTVYAGSFDGNLYAVRADGTVAWTFSTADRILSSPAIDAAGVVVVGSQDDRLYAVAPDGKMLWSVLLGGDVDGTPAIGPGGLILVGSDDKSLHALR